ncbi:MAG TPA: FkbM family methyltransferase [Ignavibacteria bacterium]|jgi:FkbM family methyltransferase
MLKTIKVKSEILLRKTGVKFGMNFKMTDEERVILLLKYNKIDLIFDIGANTGQYARELFSLGYKGKIVSIEPLSGAYNQLLKHSENNVNWIIAERCALGDKNEDSEINITENSVSSSLMEILPGHTDSEPASKIIGKENIKVYTLDSIADKFIVDNNITFLKIDTQGFEEKVLKGAETTLKRVKGVQLELSLVKLFEGQKLYLELIEMMKSYGFDLYSVEPAFTDKRTGRLLQVNGLFFRE